MHSLRKASSRNANVAMRLGLVGARTLATKMANGCVTMDNKNGIAVLTLDDPEAKVNSLNKRLQDDMAEAFTKVESDPAISAAVLISGKPGCFIAGADINMLSQAKSAEELTAMSTAGQEMMNKFAAGKPKVAAIAGSCLGGGLEVALACHYRVAADHPKTSLGLPEVQLGLLPGAGGTQRLPKLIGAQNALPLMLTGKQLKAKQAKKMKLIDGVADVHALEHAGIVAAQGLANGTIKPDREPKGMQKYIRKALEEHKIGRDFLLKKAREGVMKQTKGKYPAPLKIIDCVQAGLEEGSEAGYKVEADNFGQLGMTSESKALISVFFGSTAAKKNRFGNPAKKVNTLAVLGAGLMGAGICQVSIEKKFNVIVKDLNEDALARGEAQIWNNLKKKKSLSTMDKHITMGRLSGILADAPAAPRFMKRCDLVLEAVFEDLALKHKVIKALESEVREDCIIATNTSSLEVTGIAAAAKRPEKVIGMHYFSPVEKMPLLEIIPHDKTDKETCAAAVDVGIRQGKTVIVVKDVPGFYVNRCLGPYMSETMSQLAAGVDPERIDKCITRYGMPVGPVALCDEVGADVALHVNSHLPQFLGDRMKGGDATGLTAMVEAGFLGRKSGKGFYLYEGKKKEINPEMEAILAAMREGKEQLDLTDEEVAERMVMRFANEAVFCLQDNIIESAVDGDIGAIFGCGFPPFLGGPFRWIDSMGAQNFVDKMNKYADKSGAQFAPAQLIVDHAKAGTKFHKD